MTVHDGQRGGELERKIERDILIERVMVLWRNLVLGKCPGIHMDDTSDDY